MDNATKTERIFERYDAIGDFEYGMLDHNNKKWAVIDSTSGQLIRGCKTMGEAKDVAKEKSRERKAQKKPDKAQAARLNRPAST